jgi:hypothetical protein
MRSKNVVFSMACGFAVKYHREKEGAGRMSRTDKEVIKPYLVAPQGMKKPRSAGMRFSASFLSAHPHIRFVISLALQCKHKEA